MTEKEIRVQLEKWRGYSAYDIAVQNGFTGTQAEWLEELAGGTIQITVNGKVIDTDGDIKLYAGDIPMEAGALNTVKTKFEALEKEKISMQTTVVTLSASEWSSKTQTVSVEGITKNNVVIVAPPAGSYQKYHGCAVLCSAQADGTLTFTCTTVPDSDVEANILILN